MKYAVPKMIMSGLVFLASSIALAAPLTVPNSFTSGTTARASEVNENFSAVETAVDDNDSRISTNTATIAAIQTPLTPSVFDGTGTRIGFLVTAGESNITILTEEGYILNPVSKSNGSALNFVQEELYFSSLDCSGIAYTRMGPSFVRATYDLAGVIVLTYSDRNSVPTANFPYNSIISGGGGCNVQSGTQPSVSPALLNDPIITGVPNSGIYQLPIKFLWP